MGYMRINLKAELRKKAAAVITVVVFIAAMVAVCAAMIILERPDVSELEHRDLEDFPEFSLAGYIDGSFAQKLDKYFTDTVPFRDKLTEYAAVLENAKGIPAPQFYGVEIVNDSREYGIAEASEAEDRIVVILPETEPPKASVTEEQPVTVVAAEETAATTTVPESAVTGEVTEAVAAVAAAKTTETESVAPATETADEFVGDIKDFLNNGILVNGVDMYGEKAGIMLFGGNDKQGERYANLINYCKKELGSDVNVYNMVVPTSVEFYLPKKYSKYSNSEKAEINFIYSKLDKSVIPVDAYSVLAEHKDEYIYFRTDHHWTDLGAYYAYVAFCNTIGQTPPSLEDYEVKTKEELFVGSLFGYTGDITLKNNPDVFTYYKTKSPFKGESFYYNTLTSAGANMIYHEYAKGSSMYGMFLGSDSMHIKMTTSSGTGRKIVMFKESYGNAFAPYLIDSFDEIYVIDIRYFGTNAIDYIKKVGATDVLFINNVFAANTSMLINGIERLLTSPTGTVVIETQPAVTEAPAAGTVTDKDGKPVTASTSKPAAAKPAATKPAAQTTAPAAQTKAPAATSEPAAQTTAPPENADQKNNR